MLQDFYDKLKKWWTEAGLESVGFFAAFLVLLFFGKNGLAHAALGIFVYINFKLISTWLKKWLGIAWKWIKDKISKSDTTETE